LNRFSRALESVVFPPPEGAEMIKRLPGLRFVSLEFQPDGLLSCSFMIDYFEVLSVE
jgi:hypothetical protein